ncbi:CoA transferase [[Mycobacterium] wendilense]|uniref:CoA transferase n=1 Tax=[Mycobacterium] wendilense TaxID=3064284 RepID=A0ABM9MIH9_9MYCO|nr:CoA transferase [Mycolicibacterium sp. MU0050]CAJ1586044.1 CoA transferase [Mycolicibacterium sp. MU0050]
MHRPMEGVRILEVAQYTFVPAAAAILADWGADVIKVEHAEKGDAQRGLVRVLGLDAGREGSSFAPIMEGPNRSKRSIGLDLEKQEARPVLEELVRRSDVFLTNYLPSARRKLGINVEDIRKINPDIIYAVGSGFGSEGPDAERGAYDSTAFWARGGSADGLNPPGTARSAFMPSGAYGDNMGGLSIAAGISAALYGRKCTGKPSEIDVSLLAVGAWATQFNVNLAMMTGGPLPKADSTTQAPGNPLTGSYRTLDGRWLQFAILQPIRYWREFFTAIGLDDVATDPRYDTLDRIAADKDALCERIAESIASRTYADWVVGFKDFTGQWAPVQDGWDMAHDEALLANGRIVEVVDADGVRQRLVANPVKFDNHAVQMERAPQFAEHTDEILRELGVDDEGLIELKIAGAAT